MRPGTQRSEQITVDGRVVVTRSCDGQTLAFGSFWISDDPGDTWQCVSEHLPRVYVV